MTKLSPLGKSTIKMIFQFFSQMTICSQYAPNFKKTSLGFVRLIEGLIMTKFVIIAFFIIFDHFLRFWFRTVKKNKNKTKTNKKKHAPCSYLWKIKILFRDNICNIFIFTTRTCKLLEHVILRKLLLQKLNHCICLVNCFFQMLAVIFMWKATGIAALIFLPRTFNSYKRVLSLHLLKRWKPDKTLQSNAVILFSRKFSFSNFLWKLWLCIS